MWSGVGGWLVVVGKTGEADVGKGYSVRSRKVGRALLGVDGAANWPLRLEKLFFLKVDKPLSRDRFVLAAGEDFEGAEFDAAAPSGAGVRVLLDRFDSFLPVSDTVSLGTKEPLVGMGSRAIAMLFLRLVEKLFLPLENDLRPPPFGVIADSPSDSEPELHRLLPVGVSLPSARTATG